MKNLEASINKTSFEIAEYLENENNINKMLGVLSNYGVYALWIFSKKILKDEKNKEFWNKIFNGLEELIISFGILDKNDKGLSEKSFEKLSEDLEKVLFFKDVLEKVLVYSRYHVKAMDKGKNGGE
ncbi:conserved hypothetical protein [Thermosipho africanus TCF52B]|uniref:CRISPR type III-B/RAMP module-associated protein Cmr5 n=1 Tax=Thermosipho africanus (strain TCF52B) TaxID=484019 RepID=B7IGV1_THEAB|nr:hypothetical protein [Thermosipho africanus]ACJ75315.1 conserved hypothetical protein [Thermosipho africanus TCF52B]